MATLGKCPGNTMKVFMYLWSAITTLRIVLQTVFLLSFSASPTSYRYVPLAKKRKAIQIICGTVVAWLRRVGFLIWGSRSRQRYNIPSAENLYLSYKCSSENASGFCLSLITLSLRKALCTIWAPMSTGFSKYGEAILLLRYACYENGFACVTLLTADWSNICLRSSWTIDVCWTEPVPEQGSVLRTSLNTSEMIGKFPDLLILITDLWLIWFFKRISVLD